MLVFRKDRNKIFSARFLRYGRGNDAVIVWDISAYLRFYAAKFGENDRVSLQTNLVSVCRRCIRFPVVFLAFELRESDVLPAFNATEKILIRGVKVAQGVLQRVLVRFPQPRVFLLQCGQRLVLLKKRPAFATLLVRRQPVIKEVIVDETNAAESLLDKLFLFLVRVYPIPICLVTH